MCNYCSQVRLIESFYSPLAYEKTLEHFKDLIYNKKFILVRGKCDIEKVKDEKGYWASDTIFHRIKCPVCRQKFNCSSNTKRLEGSVRE